MASEFITRVERDKDEPYTVIFSTDDADKYKHIEDECRKMIGHAKPTVDAVPVVAGDRNKLCPINHGLRCKDIEDCAFWCEWGQCAVKAIAAACADEERRTDD